MKLCFVSLFPKIEFAWQTQTHNHWLIIGTTDGTH